jgi:hypothetical protein
MAKLLFKKIPGNERRVEEVIRARCKEALSLKRQALRLVQYMVL